MLYAEMSDNWSCTLS